MKHYYSNIPKHILTHYAYDIRPIAPSAPKTLDGVKNKPQIQRKLTKPTKPIIAAQHIISAPVAQPKPIAPRNKFRKDINKDALAVYFDNYVLSTITEEKMAEWLMQTLQELDAADKQTAKMKYEAMYDMEQRYTLYDKILNIYPEMRGDNSSATGPHLNILTMPDKEFTELKKAVETIEAALIISVISGILHTIITVMDTQEKPKTVTEQPAPAVAQPKNTVTHDSSRIAINENIVDRFMKKYHGADTAAAMRALDKKKRNATELAAMLRQLERTK